MFKDFCRQTSLNGFGFLFSGDHERRHLAYTVVWSVVIAVTSCYAVYISYEAYTFYSASTVNLNLVSPSAPLDSVSFPAMIVCNTKLLRTSLVLKLREDEA